MNLTKTLSIAPYIQDLVTFIVLFWIFSKYTASFLCYNGRDNWTWCPTLPHRYYFQHQSFPSTLTGLWLCLSSHLPLRSCGSCPPSYLHHLQLLFHYLLPPHKFSLYSLIPLSQNLHSASKHMNVCSPVKLSDATSKLRAVQGLLPQKLAKAS